MRKILLLGIAIFATSGLYAQIVCNETSISGATPEIKTALGKGKELANLYSITLPYSAEDIKAALHERLDKEGLSGTKAKNNYYAFKEVQYSYLWDKTCDIYVSITGNKAETSINLLISMGYDNYVNPYADTITTEKAFKWLIAVDQVVKDYIYEKELATHLEEQKEIDKEIKKLEKQRSKIESKIKKNEDKQLKLEASKTIVSEDDLNVDSKKIAKEQLQAIELQNERKKLDEELNDIQKKIKDTKGDLNKKKNTITEFKRRNNQ
jgi:vacuolar-type H+-ATPase subunit I/STV1